MRAGRLGGPRRPGRVSFAVIIVAAVALLAAAGLLVLRPPGAVAKWLRALDAGERRSVAIWADPSAAAAHLEAIDEGQSYRPAGSYQESEVAAYTAAQLRMMGYEVWEQPFTRLADDGQAVSVNIVALGRSRPSEAGAHDPSGAGTPTVLVGAPLSPESALTATRFDDGSGLAAMLECARAVSEMQLDFNVAFVAFGGSAHGRAGSKAFCDGIASGPVAPGGLAMAIVIDAVDGDAPISLIPWAGTRASSPRVLEGAADAIHAATGSRVRFDTTLAFMRTVAADSSPFIVAGTPALTLTTSPSSPHFRVGADRPLASPGRGADTEVRAREVARAADAGVATLLWAGREAAGGRLARVTWAPYLALVVGGSVVAVPYAVAVAVSAFALFVGVLSVAFAGRLVWLGLDRPRASGVLPALFFTGALYAIMSAVFWTGAIPSALVGVTRGLARPWTAHPAAHAMAGAFMTALTAVSAASMAGKNPVSRENRVPLLRIALVAQVGLVGYSLFAIRAGALVAAVSLLFTAASLVSSTCWLRTAFVMVAPLPAVWLLGKLAAGIGHVTVGDLVEVPVLLALLVAAAMLPYVLTVLTLRSRRGRLDSLEPYDGFGGVGAAGGGGRGGDWRVGAGGGAGSMAGPNKAGLPAVLALAALVLTAALFAYPSYTPQRPRLVVATFGAGADGDARVTLESRESLRGVTVAPTAGGSTTVGDRVRHRSVELGGRAPDITVDATLEAPGEGDAGPSGGVRLVITATSSSPLAWAVAEVRGASAQARMVVAAADCSYSLLGAGAMAAVPAGLQAGGGAPVVGAELVAGLNRTGLASYGGTIELAEPAGVDLEVVVRAGAEDETVRAAVSGGLVKALLRNEYEGRAFLKAAQ